MKLPINYEKASASKRREAREQYIWDQDDKCMHCDEHFDNPPPTRILIQKINWDLFPPNFLKYPVHLQHNHDTGMTEGAVHAYCNAVMWQYHGR